MPHRPRTLTVAFVIGLIGACGSRTGLDARCEQDGGEACCMPEDEVCNGLDDDCDGVADDGLSCVSLNGERIASIQSDRCRAGFYSYDVPDSESANPSPDIRESGLLVAAAVGGPSCGGVSVVLITDLPMDGDGGELRVPFSVSPRDAASLIVGDEDRECTFDPTRGEGLCDFVWQSCCTDGLMVGEFTDSGCMTFSAQAPAGLSRFVFHDGISNRRQLAFDQEHEVCVTVTPDAP